MFDRSDLIERVFDLCAELAEQGGAVAAFIPVDALGRELALDPQRNETLLRAHVEVALDPPALVIGARLDPRP